MQSNRLVNTILSIDYEGVEGEAKELIKKFRDDAGYASPGFANLVTSETGKGTHYPLLDIDVPMWIATSTNGNRHIGFQVELSQDDFFEVLDVLSKHGIIQEGYKNASKERGFSSLRLPGLRKGGLDDYFLSRDDEPQLPDVPNPESGNSPWDGPPYF